VLPMLSSFVIQPLYAWVFNSIYTYPTTLVYLRLLFRFRRFRLYRAAWYIWLIRLYPHPTVTQTEVRAYSAQSALYSASRSAIASSTIASVLAIIVFEPFEYLLTTGCEGLASHISRYRSSPCTTHSSMSGSSCQASSTRYSSMNSLSIWMYLILPSIISVMNCSAASRVAKCWVSSSTPQQKP